MCRCANRLHNNTIWRLTYGNIDRLVRKQLINITKKAEVRVLRFFIAVLFYDSFLFYNSLGCVYAFVSSVLCLGSFLANNTML